MAYNTTPFHGKTARIEKNTVLIGYSDGWEIEAEVDFDDITSQGDSWEDQIAGIARWRGSMSFKFVAGNTEQKALMDNVITATPGTKLTDVQFNLDSTTNAFTGDIHLLGASIAANKGGKVTYNVPFKGSGALTLTASA